MGDLVKNSLRGRFDSLSHYDEKMDKYYSLRKERYLLRHVLGRLGKKARILDAGCGTAYLSRRLAKQGYGNIVCLDTSSTLLEVAKRHGLKTVLGDAQRLPFKKGSFDLVILADVLEHVPDYGRVISEAARVLSAHGCVFVSYPNENIVPFLNLLGKMGVKLDTACAQLERRKVLAALQRHFTIEAEGTLMLISKLPAPLLAVSETLEKGLPSPIMRKIGLMHVFVGRRK